MRWESHLGAMWPLLVPGIPSSIDTYHHEKTFVFPRITLLLIHSFIHSLIHSFTHSLIHSFTHSLIHSLIHSLTHSLTHFTICHIMCLLVPSLLLLSLSFIMFLSYSSRQGPSKKITLQSHSTGFFVLHLHHQS